MTTFWAFFAPPNETFHPPLIRLFIFPCWEHQLSRSQKVRPLLPFSFVVTTTTTYFTYNILHCCLWQLPLFHTYANNNKRRMTPPAARGGRPGLVRENTMNSLRHVLAKATRRGGKKPKKRQQQITEDELDVSPKQRQLQGDNNETASTSGDENSACWC